VTTNNTLLKEFPNKRIKAIDGMAVTADVWDEEHRFHRQSLRYHNLYSHGSGIVTGLQVIASDPADTSVYILPGVAVDSAGSTVVISEPTAYDIGRQVEGLLHLVLTYGETRPRAEGDQSTQEGAPLYVQAEFGVQALNTLPPTPHVELARVRRQGRTSAIADAKDPAQPGVNEIDLRWRQQNVVTARETVGVAVFYAGMADRRHGQGVMNLARSVRHSGPYNVVVEDNASLTTGLDDYALVCLVGQRAFQLSPEEQNTLQAYVQAGGTVFLEACRREGVPGADQSFADLLNTFGVKVADAVKARHAVLTSPNFFAMLPAGYETQGTPALQAGGGAILSLADYGCVWSGERRSGAASREEIRAAFELGENILNYAIERRRAAKSK
jgi:hypothetical protein